MLLNYLLAAARNLLNNKLFSLINVALAEPNQVVLTESTAKKYFGGEAPVGKMLSIGSSGSFNSMVTGVVAWSRKRVSDAVVSVARN